MCSSSSAATGAICARLVDEAVATGELAFDLEVHSQEVAPGVFAAELCYPGQINLWSGSMFGVNGIDPDDSTRAEIVTRQHAMRLVTFLKDRLDGFEHARLEYTAANSACARRDGSSVSPRPHSTTS